MSDQEATAAAIGGIPVPRDLEDALLAWGDRMNAPDPLDTPAEAPAPVPLPGLEDLEPDRGIPTDRGADAVARYVAARIAEENRAAGMLPRPDGRKISRGQALTRIRAALIEAGYHPLVRLPLLEDPPGETCGTCAHLLGEAGSYRKCARHRQTRAAETDVRISWPACVLWEDAR